MPTIVPCVTAVDPHDYRQQMERIAPFAERVHIDFMDGVFAPTKSPGLSQAWWVKTVIADFHLMYKTPDRHLDKIISLEPHMVIVHAEADGDFLAMAEKLHDADIKVGVALLPETTVDKIELSLPAIDHVMIFGGDLGHFGGKADLSLLNKVKQLRKLKPELEIGWDGGVSDENAGLLIAAGVDVLNTGGYIQKAKDPGGAYAKLRTVTKLNTK